MTMTTISCDRCRELLVSDENQDGSSLTRHLDACPGCAAFAADLERLKALARELPRPAAPAARISARPVRRLAAGLAVGVGVLLVLGGLWLRGGPTSISGQVDSGVSLAALETQDVDLLAAIDQARQVWTRSSDPQEEWSWLDLPAGPGSPVQLPRTDLLESQLYLDLVSTSTGGIP